MRSHETDRIEEDEYAYLPKVWGQSRRYKVFSSSILSFNLIQDRKHASVPNVPMMMQCFRKTVLKMFREMTRVTTSIYNRKLYRPTFSLYVRFKGSTMDLKLPSFQSESLQGIDLLQSLVPRKSLQAQTSVMPCTGQGCWLLSKQKSVRN